MKQGIFVAICMALAPALSAQDTARSWLLKTDLISYFPDMIFNTGKANAEIELPLRGKERSACFSLGYIYSYGSTGHYDYFFIEQGKTTGYLVKGEYRFYTGRRRIIEPLCLLIWPLATQLNNTKERYTGLYFSPQAVIVHQWITMVEEYAQPLEQPETYPNVIPKLFVRIGFQSISPNSVVVDQSLGLGVQYSITPYTRYAGIYPAINYSLKLGFAR